MDRRLSYSAFLLLVAFVAGGVVAPSVHKIWHAAETEGLRASHLAEATHHHHQDGDSHDGAEAVEHCPAPLASDWTCVLCQGVSVYLAGLPGAAVPPDAQEDKTGGAEALARSVTIAHDRIRGPPQDVV